MTATALSVFVSGPIEKLAKLVWHWFELLECWSVTVTLDAGFALMPGYCFNVSTFDVASRKNRYGGGCD